MPPPLTWRRQAIARDLLVMSVGPFRALRLWRNGRGVAAVEFSLILAVALLIMGLVVYGGQIYRVERKGDFLRRAELGVINRSMTPVAWTASMAGPRDG